MRKDWALPYSALGNLLSRSEKDKEAEPLLRRALQLGAKDFTTLDSLSTVRWRAGDKPEALALAQRATEDEGAPASAWVWRGIVERANGNTKAAAASLDHALQMEPKNVAALRERAEGRVAAAEYDQAIEDLKAALLIVPGDKEISLRLAGVYELAGKKTKLGGFMKRSGNQSIRLPNCRESLTSREARKTLPPPTPTIQRSPSRRWKN